MIYREARAALEKLTDDRRELIEKIGARVELECESLSDYYLHSEENPVADYVGKIGYGGELLHEVEDRLDSIQREKFRMCYDGDPVDEVCDFLRGFIKRDRRDAVDLLVECSTLECTDIYYGAWVICSMTIGEVGNEISDELRSLLEKLTGEENQICEALFSVSKGTRWLYEPLNYNRWVMTLDPDKVMERIKEKQIGSGRKKN